MIFCRTKRTAQKVADELAERGFAVGAVHGDLGQVAREQALRAFRNGKVDVLVATDVAARGIDIDDVTHVINYECPEDEQDLPAPHRPHRPRRQDRRGDHPGRLGRAAALVDDRQGAGAGLPGSGRDLLQLRRTSTPNSASRRRHRLDRHGAQAAAGQEHGAGSAPPTPSANVRAEPITPPAPAPASRRPDTSSGAAEAPDGEAVEPAASGDGSPARKRRRRRRPRNAAEAAQTAG